MAKLREGARVGAYRLRERLGSGAAAEVWAAEREGPEGFRRAVVLKCFTNDHEVSQSRLWARLDHPNVVRCHALEELDGRMALVLDFVDGVDLRAIAGRMEPDVAAFVVGEVLRALACAHEAGLLHRDVSPANVLVSTSGEIKLTDFGLAKELDSTVTEGGALRGHLSYSPPEQLARAPLDVRADLYAAGVVLYELLTGARLWRPPDLSTAMALRRLGVPKPSSKNPAVSEALDGICRRATATAVDARFAGAAEMAEALEGARGRERAACVAEVRRLVAEARRLVAEARAERGAREVDAPPASRVTASVTPRAWRVWPVAGAIAAAVAVAIGVAAVLTRKPAPSSTAVAAPIFVAPAPRKERTVPEFAAPASSTSPAEPRRSRRPVQVAPKLTRGQLLDPFGGAR